MQLPGAWGWGGGGGGALLMSSYINAEKQLHKQNLLCLLVNLPVLAVARTQQHEKEEQMPSQLTLKTGK